MNDEERQAWITDLKRKHGVRCTGDEGDTPRLPAWPVLDYVPGGTTYTCVADYAMASWDGVHWYEKPEDMTTEEFFSSLR